MRNLIYNGQIIVDGKMSIPQGYILFFGNDILEVGSDESKLETYLSDQSIECYDAKGNWVLPGLIDIHNHGADGIDFVAADNDGVNHIAKKIINEGVTGFLASTTVDDKKEMLEMAKRLGEYKYEDGAICLGIHMEGPFLSDKYRAVMRLEYLRNPDIEEYEDWQKASKNFIKVITIAPELKGALEFIRQVKYKTIVMIGHTNADVKTVELAKDSGAKGFTHFYNAMSQHLHREPGVVTAGFLWDELYCELICDGWHINKDVLKMTIKQLTPERIILITDAMPGKGMADGRFLFCKQWIIKENGQTHIEGETRIAGSTTPLNEMCRNVMEWCSCSINDIVQMACVNPSNLLKENKKGQLVKGYDADIVVFDSSFNPLVVYVKGDRKL